MEGARMLVSRGARPRRGPWAGPQCSPRIIIKSSIMKTLVNRVLHILASTCKTKKIECAETVATKLQTDTINSSLAWTNHHYKKSRTSLIKTYHQLFFATH